MPRGIYPRRPRTKTFTPFDRCSVGDCGRDATRRGRVLCEMHFSRMRFRGSFDAPPPPIGRYRTADGYVLVNDPAHPLAHARGTVLEHRRVYFAANGIGPFNCHWCGVPVEWGTLHIDHVNDVRDDNRLENLVASCAICNPMRGFHKSLASNQARGRNLTFRGERLPIRVWAERLGITKESLKNRLAKGWPLDRALTEPRGKYGPRASL